MRREQQYLVSGGYMSGHIALHTAEKIYSCLSPWFKTFISFSPRLRPCFPLFSHLLFVLLVIVRTTSQQGNPPVKYFYQIHNSQSLWLTSKLPKKLNGNKKISRSQNIPRVKEYGIYVNVPRGGRLQTWVTMQKGKSEGHNHDMELQSSMAEMGETINSALVFISG